MKMTEKAIQTFKEQLIENANKYANIIVDSAVEANGHYDISFGIYADENGTVGYKDNIDDHSAHINWYKNKKADTDFELMLIIKNKCKDYDDNISTFYDYMYFSINDLLDIIDNINCENCEKRHNGIDLDCIGCIEKNIDNTVIDDKELNKNLHDELKEHVANYKNYIKEQKEAYANMLESLAERFAEGEDMQKIYDDEMERLCYLS